jgi:hypothetical protein
LSEPESPEDADDDPDADVASSADDAPAVELTAEPTAEPAAEPDDQAESASAPDDEPEPEPEPAAPGPAADPGGASEESPFSVEGMLEALRQAKVGELLLSTISTLASVAYGKLELRDVAEAKTAIDAIGALVPLLAGQIDDGIRRDVDQALTNLRLAYADAVSNAQ